MTAKKKNARVAHTISGEHDGKIREWAWLGFAMALAYMPAITTAAHAEEKKSESIITAVFVDAVAAAAVIVVFVVDDDRMNKWDRTRCKTN